MTTTQIGSPQITVLDELRTGRSAPDAHEPQAIEATEVSFAFTRRYSESLPVLHNVSFDIASGERVAIIGPSGCGKSTLLSIIAGLLKPQAGDCVVDGEVALMPQRDLLLPWRSALCNAALALEAQGVPKTEALERAHPIFMRFGLGDFENAMPHELSGGMRQRVAFLRTVLTGRPILALDEPFGALDSLTRAQMQQWLTDALQERISTMVMVTHDVDEALVLADRVLVLSKRPATVVTQFVTHQPAGLERDEWVTSLQFAQCKRAILAALR
ncbi:MAG: ABC transporter ATP-binding protein [Thermoleophilaceae bacterium]|nr:ABC transporter ATP-binding protein [Thermoleophilaceae bacterium]